MNTKDLILLIGEAIARVKRAPRVWMQMSTATIYAHRYDAANDELTGVIGGNEPGLPDTWKFSVDVAKAWEAVALDASTPATRKVLLRSAIIMNPGAGGPFHMLGNLVRCGLGGRAGDGRQFVSWIHGEDFIAALDWLIAHEEIAGPVNLAAPNSLPNAAFMGDLRKATGVPFGLPAAKWMLEIGAFFLRTETELILKSRRVVPGRLLNSGFAFRYNHWADAATDLARQSFGGRFRP